MNATGTAGGGLGSIQQHSRHTVLYTVQQLHTSLQQQQRQHKLMQLMTAAAVAAAAATRARTRAAAAAAVTIVAVIAKMKIQQMLGNFLELPGKSAELDGAPLQSESFAACC
jgi:hypothetical protein